MEKIVNYGDTVIRYDDDINKVGVNLVVKAIKSKYPFVVGYRVKDITSVIFIELKVDCEMLGGKSNMMKMNFLSSFFDVDRDVDENIKKMSGSLYDALPEDMVNFYYAKYGWSDKEFKQRSSLNMLGYYCK